MGIKSCKIISLPKFTDDRGNLTYIENKTHIPFDIKRVYYLYNIPKEEKRGAHGHVNLEQLVVAVSGSFDIALDDASGKRTFHLDSPDFGLYVSKGIWRDMFNFSDDAVCMVLASELFNEEDYIRNYDEFIQLMKQS